MNLWRREDFFHWPGGQVEPLMFAVAQVWQTEPMEHAGLIAADVEHRVGRRAIEEMDAAVTTAAFDIEAADAVARYAH